MSETPLQDEEKRTQSPQTTHDDFDDALEIANAANAARSLFDSEATVADTLVDPSVPAEQTSLFKEPSEFTSAEKTPTGSTVIKLNEQRGQKVAAGLVIGAFAGGAAAFTGAAIPHLVEEFKPTTFSEESQPATAVSGDGTLSIVDRLIEEGAIKNATPSDRMDIALEVEDRSHEVYKDGLQAGETVSVPIAINPKNTDK